MGKYLDPKPQPGQSVDQAKYAFCEQHGKQISKEEFENTKLSFGSTHIPVCIVKNAFFSAALICDHQGEINYVRDNPDSRPKVYYSVGRKEIERYLLGEKKCSMK
jgi:hypothetical protein